MLPVTWQITQSNILTTKENFVDIHSVPSLSPGLGLWELISKLPPGGLNREETQMDREDGQINKNKSS